MSTSLAFIENFRLLVTQINLSWSRIASPNKAVQVDIQPG